MRKLLPLLFLWSAAAVAQLQTPIAIRNLPPATAVSGTDLTIDDQFGSCPGTASITCTRVATFNQVLAFIESNYAGGLPTSAPFTILGNGTSSSAIPYALSATGSGSFGYASVGLPAFSGTPTAGHCVEWLSATTLEDSGSACGGGGGGNVSNSGTPTQYQLAGWVTSTSVQGIGPGTSGQALVSNGATAYPSFSATLSGVNSVNGTSIPASTTLTTVTGAITAGHCVEWFSASVLEDAGAACGSGGGSGAFNAITSGTNTTATMTLGAGGTLTFTSTGVVNANQINSGIVPASAPLLASNFLSQPIALGLGANLAVVGTTLQTSQGINAQVGTSYTVHATDEGGLITFNNAASVAVTLPQAGTTGFQAGFSFDAQNLGAGTVTITPTTSTINGAATLTIAQNTGCTVSSDGGNYQISACTAVSSGGGSGGSFSAIGSGTNTTATMTVGSGATITTTGTGVVNANELGGSTLSTYFGALPVAIGNSSAAAGTYTYTSALGVGTNATVVLLDNTTPATGTPGTDQSFSPTLALEGQGWKTSSSASVPVIWNLSTEPASGLPGSFLIFNSVINGSTTTSVSLNSVGFWAGAGFTVNIGPNSASTCGNCMYLAATNNPAIGANGVEALGFTSTLNTSYVPMVVGPTAFTVSGCGTAGSVTGNGAAGTFTVGTGASTCTFIFTINGATGMTAPHGWIANVDDLTKNSHCTNATGGSTTTAEVLCNFVVATSDIITFSAVSY
jgi:hypothetical protein